MSSRAATGLLDRRRAVTSAKHRRRRTVLLGALAAGAITCGSWWVATGPILRITHVDISGYSQPDQARVIETVRVAARHGTMLRLPTVAVREALVRHPWVASVSVHHSWPRGIDVRIVQAKPIAIALTATGERLVISDSGRILGPDADDLDLPRFRTPALTAGQWLRGAAQRAPFEFISAMKPEVARAVTELRVGGGVATARLIDGPELRLGPPAEMWAKGRAVEAVLGDPKLSEPLRRAEYLDVSAPSQPTLGGFPADEHPKEGSTEGSGSTSGGNDPRPSIEARLTGVGAGTSLPRWEATPAGR